VIKLTEKKAGTSISYFLKQGQEYSDQKPPLDYKEERAASPSKTATKREKKGGFSALNTHQMAEGTPERQSGTYGSSLEGNLPSGVGNAPKGEPCRPE